MQHLAAIAGIILVVAVFHPDRARWLDWRLSTRYNPAVLEGAQWWHGRLDLPERLWDTALVPGTGRVFNVFPPLLSVIGCALNAPWWSTTAREGLAEFSRLPLLLFAILPLLTAYAVLARRTGTMEHSRPRLWATILTIGWLGGTAVWPCMQLARLDGIHHINHLLSQVGLFLMASDLLGARRWWPAVVGLAIAAWSRPPTIVYALAIVGTAALARDACAAGVGGPVRYSRLPLWPSRERLIRLVLILAAVGAVAALPMALNKAKFGSVWNSGYELIYEGRTTGMAADAGAHGLFSLHFVPRNAYYMNVAVPWTASPEGWPRWEPSPFGASVWVTTPILLLALMGIGSWIRERGAGWLMLCTLAIIGVHLLYHNTGYVQFGYYRFALDYVPVWLTVAARWLCTGWPRWPALACVGWSVTYFAVLERCTAVAA